MSVKTLNLDLLQFPGQISIDEMLRRRETKAQSRFNQLECMVAGLMDIYDEVAETTDDQVKSDLLQAALRKCVYINEVRREIELERHEKAMAEFNTEHEELKVLQSLV